MTARKDLAGGTGHSCAICDEWVSFGDVHRCSGAPPKTVRDDLAAFNWPLLLGVALCLVFWVSVGWVVWGLVA